MSLYTVIILDIVEIIGLCAVVCSAKCLACGCVRGIKGTRAGEGCCEGQTGGGEGLADQYLRVAGATPGQTECLPYYRPTPLLAYLIHGVSRMRAFSC